VAKTITYNAPSDKLAITGGSSEDPITPSDIYAEEVSNSWGVVHRFGSSSPYSYVFDCIVDFGPDGATYFSAANGTDMTFGDWEFHGSNATLNLQNCQLRSQHEEGNRFFRFSADSTLTKCQILSDDLIYLYNGTFSQCAFSKTTIFDGVFTDCQFSSNFQILGVDSMTRPMASELTAIHGSLDVVEPLFAPGTHVGSNQCNLTITNPFNAPGSYSVSSAGAGAYYIKTRFSVELTLLDDDGAGAAEGVNVALTDSTGTEQINQTTQADGQFDTSCYATVYRADRDEDDNYSETNLNPFTLTLTWPDGVKYSEEITIDEKLTATFRKPDHAGASNVIEGVSYAEEGRTGVYHEPETDEVRSGVTFGANESKTGTASLLSAGTVTSNIAFPSLSNTSDASSIVHSHSSHGVSASRTTSPTSHTTNKVTISHTIEVS
jgi:hypothetical protein